MGKRAVVVNFTIVRTIGFALVVIGFFMPVVRVLVNRTGFQLANGLIDNNIVMGLLAYAVFVAAVIGVIIGILLMMSRRTKISASTGWIVLLACIASGLIVFFAGLNSPSLQNGGILILIGWIAALVGQVLARGK